MVYGKFSCVKVNVTKVNKTQKRTWTGDTTAYVGEKGEVNTRTGEETEMRK